MKALVLALFVLLVLAGLVALSAGQVSSWQPSPGHTQVPIWPAAVPDAQPVAGPEVAATVNDPVAGKPWVSVGKVSQPTMTVYTPQARNMGAG